MDRKAQDLLRRRDGIGRLRPVDDLVCSTVARPLGATPQGKPQKKAAKEKGRLVSQTTFPVLRQLHIVGRFRSSAPGGLSPRHILNGCRCKSGQSRTVARTVAMVSHLRKMID